MKKQETSQSSKSRGVARKQPVEQEKKEPPNWESWTQEERTRWEERLRKIREVIGARVLNKAEATSYQLSAEAAARSGVPMDQVEELVRHAVSNGNRLDADTFERVSRAMAAGVGRKVDFPALGEFVRNHLADGTRGDTLVIGIYREMT